MNNRFQIFMMAATLATSGAVAQAHEHENSAQNSDVKTECEKVGVSTSNTHANVTENQNVEEHGTSVSHHYFWKVRPSKDMQSMRISASARSRKKNSAATSMALRSSCARTWPTRSPVSTASETRPAGTAPRTAKHRPRGPRCASRLPSRT